MVYDLECTIPSENTALQEIKIERKILFQLLGLDKRVLTMIFDDRSCLQYYKTSNYDEDHVFQLQVKPALISYFYEK